MIHKDESRLAGISLVINDSKTGLDQEVFKVVDWADRHYEKPWHQAAAAGNPVCREYAERREEAGLPDDDNVLLGRIESYYLLVHLSELELELEVSEVEFN